MPASSATHSSETLVSLEVPLRSVARELSDVAQSCNEMQWLISALLERAQHPDLPAELHMLQDIDRLQQTVIDLAALIDATAPTVRSVQVRPSALTPVLRLASLRSRIFGAPDPAPDGSDLQDDIHWF